MVPKSWILKGVAAIGAAAFCAGAVAGCAPLGGREWGACTAVGAGLGAGIGAASGIVIYDNTRKGPPNDSGKACAAAVVAQLPAH